MFAGNLKMVEVFSKRGKSKSEAIKLKADFYINSKIQVQSKK